MNGRPSVDHQRTEFLTCVEPSIPRHQATIRAVCTYPLSAFFARRTHAPHRTSRQGCIERKTKRRIGLAGPANEYRRFEIVVCFVSVWTLSISGRGIPRIVERTKMTRNMQQPVMSDEQCSVIEQNCHCQCERRGLSVS